jgi:hypothetical protein
MGDPQIEFLKQDNYGLTTLDAEGAQDRVRIILNLVNRGYRILHLGHQPDQPACISFNRGYQAREQRGLPSEKRQYHENRLGLNRDPEEKEMVSAQGVRCRQKEKMPEQIATRQSPKRTEFPRHYLYYLFYAESETIKVKKDNRNVSEVMKCSRNLWKQH